MKPIMLEFDTFEYVDDYDDEYYASLTPEERLKIGQALFEQALRAAGGRFTYDLEDAKNDPYTEILPLPKRLR